MIKVIDAHLSQRSKNVCLFFLFTIVVFVQICLLHFGIYNSILVSSLWKNPIAFFEFYAPRIGLAIGSSIILFITKNKWWMIVLSVLLTILYFLLPVIHIVWVGVLMCVQPILASSLLVVFKNNDYISLRGASSCWIIGIAFFASIIVQCYIAQYLLFEAITFSIVSLCYVISISAFLSSFVFISKRKSWVIIVSLLIDTWIVAELLYYRANGFLLDGCAMTMVGNMGGWWSSLLMLIHGYDLCIFVPTICLIVLSYVCRSRETIKSGFVLGLSLAFILNVVGCVSLQIAKYRNVLSENVAPEERVIEWNPFATEAMVYMGVERITYVKVTSIIHAFIYNLNELVTIQRSSKVDFTEEEIDIINTLVQPSDIQLIPSTPLIICLIESLESWVVQPEIMPNLCQFINSHDNILYAHNLKSQVKFGTSSDGQLIANTGLLPVDKGAVCYRYFNNTFPSLSSLYVKSCGQFPHNLSVWNQKQMSQAYSIDTNFVVSSSDIEIFSSLVKLSSRYDYILAITSSTHTPFTSYCDSSDIVLDEEMPYFMRNYIRSINYMDKGLGILLKEIDSNPHLHNATIALTGDHIIFQDDMRREFVEYDSITQAGYNVKDGYVPFIVYSPNIQQKVEIHNEAYQMDIYPTLLELIGCKEYFWQGVGVSLLKYSANASNTPPLYSFASDR